MKQRSSDGLALNFARKFLLYAGPVGRSLNSALQSSHKAVTNIRVDPNAFSDAFSFALAYQSQCLLKKFDGLDLGIDRAAVAVAKFRDSEVMCRLVNRRLTNPVRLSEQTYHALTWARDFIARVLGDFSWDDAVVMCDFGPGSSVGVPRRRSHQCQKIGETNPTITGQLLPLLEAYRKFDRHVDDQLGACNLQVVGGSKATTVPKDAKSDRFIAIEPLWNMFFQKGIGGLIRLKLRNIGLDLNYGQDLNRRLAKEGSATGRLATLDLSSASDCISLGLVDFLLPADWNAALLMTRSPRISVEGESVLLEKISSMGNGFTWELQSLIFLALTLAVSRSSRIGSDVSIYGDDIILPADRARSLIQVLQDVGFKTNVEKSYFEGPFRESCGKHYFRGQDVTPFYIRTEITTVQQHYVLANNLRRWASRLTGGLYASPTFYSLWTWLRSLVPSKFNLLIPEGVGDVGFVAGFDEAMPRSAGWTTRFCGWQGFIYTYHDVLKGTTHFGELPALVSKLWYTRRGKPLGETSQRSLESPRLTNRSVLRKGVAFQWESPCPWGLELLEDKLWLSPLSLRWVI